MDTTEELNGTYFYHGQSNLSAGELFDVIFIEQFCDELGIGIGVRCCYPRRATVVKNQNETGRGNQRDKCYLQVWENAFTKCTNSFWY
ncbi:membrane protein [Salmonella enterica subsp. enterica]|nr:membrane protein [Salmonella enterica subsp. enterica]